MKRFLLALPSLAFASSIFAQDSTPTGNGDAAGAIAGFGCGCVFLLVMCVVWIALAIWVYRDAKSRGMDNAVLLTIVTVITGVLGLIIYLLMRPKGHLVVCPSCQKKRLEGSAKCPHCGNP